MTKPPKPKLPAQFAVKTIRLQEMPTALPVSSPCEIKNFWQQNIETADWFDREKECLVVLALDTKLKLKGWNLVSLGSLNESIAHPREVFRPLVAIAAYGFIMIHNHPTGDTNPSSADHRVTEKIRSAAKTMDIVFFDHVIVGDSYYSFRESGLI